MENKASKILSTLALAAIIGAFAFNSPAEGVTVSTNAQISRLQKQVAQLQDQINVINSITPIEHYKLYAHSLIIDAKQYRGLELLWTKESNWNYKAKNKASTASGIPQLLKMTTTDPYEQISLGIKYIKHRHSTPCQAWSYWQKNKHY